MGLETEDQDKAKVVAEEMGCTGKSIPRSSDLLEGWIVMQSHPAFSPCTPGRASFHQGLGGVTAGRSS